ncbi:HNH endonuclease family protein [Nocardia brevicatena]|uniref:HNH endonuclease family protein n=1 Tax=Nocardia brevicatena TaxID=37327 RepID=UPI0002EBF233|nr:HNH endonuclease family protein [Nocardia brevicatena]
MRRRGTVGAALFAVVTVLTTICGCAVLPERTPAPGSPARILLEQWLATVRVVPDRPHPGGYERGCRAEQACVFGPAWSDDHDGPGGHDGCDTRNNVLARQLTEVAYRPGTRGCVVLSGTLADPYTGALITFSKQAAQEIPVDHVYPLAAAWDLGASSWPLSQRIRFANDIDYNLQVTTRAANTDKGDGTPAEWLPPSRPGHCFYAGKYLTVAIRYDLPVTAADHEALRDIAATCG